MKTKMTKTEQGFILSNGTLSREFASSDMRRLRARVAGLQVRRTDLSHDTAYQTVLADMLTETEGSQS